MQQWLKETQEVLWKLQKIYMLEWKDVVCLIYLPEYE
jgi:hypothetical protein